jgi:predicted TIM-barrel fold metal-dependent hydrolase
VFSHLDFEDTTIDDWVKLQDALGLSRGLHVLSMMYGHNYEIALHAQCRFPERLRACIIPWPRITDRELEILSKAGVVAARFAYRVMPTVDEAMVQRVHELGWSAHYLVRGGETGEDWQAAILRSPGFFVLEHTGNPRVAQGVDGPDFRFVLKCLDTGRCYVKLSPRFSAQDNFPFSDTLPFIRKLVEYAPERLLWGSDWPHPQYFKPMPNDVDLLDQMLDWVPDEAVRNRIFVDNPAELFGFPKVVA